MGYWDSRENRKNILEGMMAKKKPEKIPDSGSRYSIWEDGAAYGTNSTIDDFNAWFRSDGFKEEIEKLGGDIITDRGLSCKYCGVDFYRVKRFANAISDRLGKD